MQQIDRFRQVAARVRVPLALRPKLIAARQAAVRAIAPACRRPRLSAAVFCGLLLSGVLISFATSRSDPRDESVGDLAPVLDPVETHAGAADPERSVAPQPFRSEPAAAAEAVWLTGTIEEIRDGSIGSTAGADGGALLPQFPSRQ